MVFAMQPCTTDWGTTVTLKLLALDIHRQGVVFQEAGDFYLALRMANWRPERVNSDILNQPPTHGGCRYYALPSDMPSEFNSRDDLLEAGRSVIAKLREIFRSGGNQRSPG